MEEIVHDNTYAIGGVSFPLDNFVATASSVHRINICAGNPAHRKSTKTTTVIIERLTNTKLIEIK